MTKSELKEILEKANNYKGKPWSNWATEMNNFISAIDTSEPCELDKRAWDGVEKIVPTTVTDRSEPEQLWSTTRVAALEDELRQAEAHAGDMEGAVMKERQRIKQLEETLDLQLKSDASRYKEVADLKAELCRWKEGARKLALQYVIIILEERVVNSEVLARKVVAELAGLSVGELFKEDK